MPFDPTHTYHIRRTWRGEAGRRVTRLLRLTRAALIDSDMLGLGGADTAPGIEAANPHALAPRLRMFNDWFKGAAHNTVAGDDGNWGLPYMQAAYTMGLRAARELTNRGQVRPLASTRLPALLAERNRHEIAGIVDATAQNVARITTTNLLRGKRQQVAYNKISGVVKKIAGTRLEAHVAYMTVAANNSARLAEFKMLGMRKVGVVPEHVSKRAFHKDCLCGTSFMDARKSTEQMFEVLTAGDDDVCDECQDIADSGPYEISEAEDLIPVHPRCRCAFVPADDERYAEPEQSEWFENA